MLFFVSFLSGVVLFYSFQYFPFSTGLVFLAASVYLSVRKYFFYLIIIFVGIAFAFLRYGQERDISHIMGREIIVRGVFQSYPVETKSGMSRQSFDIISAFDAKKGERLHELAKREFTVFSNTEFVIGKEYSLVVRLLRDSTRLNPGAVVNDEIYAQLIGANDLGHKTISLNSEIQEQRRKLKKYLTANFKKDSASFLSAITIGDRASLDERLKNAFNTTGLAHILSISGTHFGLFSIFLFGIFRFIMNYLPYRILQRITIFLTPSQAAALLCLPFMLAYLVLSGGRIPAVRSFIMICLFLLGLLIGRRHFWLNSVLFAAFVLTLWEPKVVLDISFQLSFLAVLLIGFSLHTGGYESKEAKGIIRYPKKVLLITLSAIIGMAPLIAYHFHYVSIISPLSNLFITPVIGFLLLPLSIFSSLLFLLTGHYVFTPVVSAVTDISIVLVRFLSGIPFADVRIPSFPPILIIIFYIGLLLYFISGNKRYTLIIPIVFILMYCSLAIFEKKDLTVTHLDVGQGDSSIVELPDGKTIVIDTGRSGRETALFLKYRGKEVIDALIFSHVHPDHTGGFGYLLERFTVKEIWDSGRLIFPEDVIVREKIRHQILKRGDVVEGKGYSMYVLHPYPEFYTMYGSDYVAANNDSLVIKIKGRNTLFLFSGDVEEEAEEDLAFLGKWLKSDVLKVPHHGAKTSAHRPFFEFVSPQVAVVSVGRNNAFGHPHEEMLDALKGARISRTDCDGAIKIKETERGVKIRTYKDYKFTKAKSFKEEIKNLKRLFETW